MTQSQTQSKTGVLKGAPKVPLQPICYTTWLPSFLSFSDDKEFNGNVLKQAHDFSQLQKHEGKLKIKNILAFENKTRSMIWDYLEPRFNRVLHECKVGYNPRFYISHLYNLLAVCKIWQVTKLVTNLIKCLKRAWTLIKSTLGFSFPRNEIIPSTIEGRVRIQRFL